MFGTTEKKGPPQSQWWRTLISSLHICWFFLFTQCLNFNSKGSNPLCYSEHFLGLKQWSSEFERTGEEQQASIRVWRRGLFTELPSLHLASPLPRLGRQLQFVYLLGLAAQILAISCHCLSSHHNEKKKNQTGIHALRNSHILLSCLLCTLLFLLLSFFQVNTLPQCLSLTTAMLSVEGSLLLVFTVLSLCQSHPNASDACKACPLCAYVFAVRARPRG